MKLEELIAALSDASTFPADFGREPVEVRQTHISVVFLCGNHAVKIKKPVDLGFVNFTTLAARKHYCEREVELNRRLAPSVYLGVVPISLVDGRPRIGDDRSPFEWAVLMRRLPEEAMLGSRIHSEQAGASQLRAVAGLVAKFHREAERSPAITRHASPEAVSESMIENFEATRSHIGHTVSSNVHRRAELQTRRRLDDARQRLQERCDKGIPCAIHGDLRVEHVYWFPENNAPADWIIIDCIEFCDRFRFADPVSDMAFLAMDLQHRGRNDLAAEFIEAYFNASGDESGKDLLPLYMAYRAAVRAKVNGIKAAEREVPPLQRERAIRSARRHWLQTLSTLSEPNDRPCLILVGGLPGVGKSTLARALADRTRAAVLRTDVVRKELFSDCVDKEDVINGFDLYQPEWTEITYSTCLERAREILFNGDRAIVDASFVSAAHRMRFLQLAEEFGVPCVFIECTTDAATAIARIRMRRNDPSDADEKTYRLLASRWEPHPPGLLPCTVVLNTADSQAAVQAAAAELEQRGIFDPKASAR